MPTAIARAAFITALIAYLSAPVLAQDKLTRIRVAYPSGGICCLAMYGAIQWKIFEENGLFAEIVQIRSQIGNMALMANEIQYFTGVGPASVSATLRGMAMALAVILGALVLLATLVVERLRPRSSVSL